MTSPTSLTRLLKEYFGFTSFRPLQEEIIRSALEGRDVFALLPTGGGKSLCFQLPALAQPGLTVVVSPLIALMKDQVDALQASGIAATFLNSSLAAGESRARLRGLHQGEYRLLYAAPERLMLSGFLEDLQRWNVKLLAIDEAHCISEWGHDFRPEYRQLAQLRDLFPKVPMMALTATATGRVREDILKQLRLRDPQCFVASFDRPNLTYRVLAKQESFDQITRFLRERPRESGIIYCQARKSTESLADKLCEAGIPARPYHAGMTPGERSQNQELFLRDKVRVICATIAFGMGINKPNVRFVVHYDLPKNLEGYYQETGRAGRDGLPSECLLFFSAGDMVKHTRFIDEKPDPRERELARQQLQQILHYAESAACRRGELLRYFGEDYEDDNCGACDNCLVPRETYDGTLTAQKFLSCIYRLRQQSGFDFGVNQVVEVLTGADTEAVRKWNHGKVSTYGIGQEHSRPEWKVLGRELIRLGYVSQATDRFNVLSLTPKGLNTLKQREKIQLTRAVRATTHQIPRVGAIACDEALFERLVELRERLAAERQLHPHTLFSDVTLRLMARDYPVTDPALAGISGMSDKKLREFGPALLAEIGSHLEKNPRQIFASNSFRVATPEKAGSRPARKAAAGKMGAEEPYDTELFEKLRDVRKEIAKTRAVPAYMILHDSVLRELTRVLPQSVDELASVRQVGQNRAAQFGQPFLEAIRQHARDS
jgi:ATP-dependent DNA helicase RecQ